jgi:SNF2 family DNA or RNA helicase
LFLAALQNVVDQGKLEAAHYLLRPFMLRRVKDEVECKLPPKVETRINCPLSEFQTFWYRRLLLRDSDLLKQVRNTCNSRGVLTVLCCIIQLSLVSSLPMLCCSSTRSSHQHTSVLAPLIIEFDTCAS